MIKNSREMITPCLLKIVNCILSQSIYPKWTFSLIVKLKRVEKHGTFSLFSSICFIYYNMYIKLLPRNSFC
jgi:hypothetical protein